MFEGGAVDTGAQMSVIGTCQARAYCDSLGIDLHLPPTQSTFVFGDLKKSLGKLKIVLPTPSGDAPIETHILPAKIPFLIGLNTLDKYGWNALTVQNELHSVNEGCKIPITRKLSHMYVTWENQYVTHYSRQQLQNMHLHFMHPSVSKLLNLLERAYQDQVTEDTKEILKDISDACHICQTYSSKPITSKSGSRMKLYSTKPYEWI
ncbi:unnamed protein product [Chondrus crispus]|uniref:Uncharacterized protein n=1 Tax=Chondrus crispus TaxID=2769 RepID=R7Q1R3_CHOCR|nr:unnamed protein product [Chondrus crispus]CDF32512.1 unnamed protein product [Chondrus crispus]|eukprot:XP_005712177.1 unnamed protein product [Chondrus crispus]